MKTGYKILIWHILVGILGWVLWSDVFSLVHNLNKLVGLSYGDLRVIIPIISFAVLVATGLTIFQKRWIPLSFGAISGFMFLLVFGAAYLNIFAALVGIGAFALAGHDIKTEVRERIKINPRVILKRGLPVIMLSLFLMFACTVFGAPAVKSLGKTNKIPPQAETFVRNLAYDIAVSFDKSLAGQRQAVNLIANQTIQSLNSIVAPYLSYVPFAAPIILFLILWSLDSIFVIIGAVVGMLLFYILRKIKFIQIQEVDAKAESIII